MKVIRNLTLILIFLLGTVLNASADVTLDCARFGSVSETFAAIPEDAGAVTVILSDRSVGPDDSGLSIPEDRGITELTLAMPEDLEKLPLEGIERICANGIPLTVGTGLEMPDTSIYGGACVSGGEAELESSSVRIFGTVGFVFGGGYAEEGGSSAVKKTSVLIGEGGLAYYEVFGGGQAYGSGSRVNSDETSVTVFGTTDYVLGAGFAEDGGISECGMTDVTIGEKASVEVALFGGGSAAGEGSLSTVENPLTRLSGFAHWSFPGDFAFDGGETRVNASGRLEILPSGSSVNAFLGSFASDAGSTASMNTAELMNCGEVELVIERGQGTDGGTAQTMITANFPCDLP